ncbi:MAG: lysylphosphatidylglycerol synthase domain-containing protein, partial [Myxococcota bacterium]
TRLVGGVVASLQRLAREPRATLVAVGWTTLSWSSTIALVWLAQQAFPGVPTSLATTLVLWTAIICAMSVLPTPGFFGPFEAAGVAALAVFGTDPVAAKAFALAFHLVLFSFAVTIAALSMVSMGLSLADLRPRLEPAQSTPR